MIATHYSIKTHKVGNSYKLPHFFILNKGLNSGKPLKKPCPNCFVVIVNSEEERDRLYYLCFSLHIGKYFSFYLVGSVIPFIRINDAKAVILQALINYENNQWNKRINQLKKVIIYEQNLKQQLHTIEKLKVALLKV